ncbi:MAG: YabP/YqfC family sporulation protein [Clostridia bacterium]|nr:YabP/YqfC family sporulation protein [Clostridia bacterium]
MDRQVGAQMPQNIILEGRKKLSVSGVEDIDSFDEFSAVIFTSMGLIEVKGKDIHMNKLNLESGEIVLEGEFDSVIYPDANSAKPKKNFVARLLGGE